MEEHRRVLGNSWADTLAKEIATRQVSPNDVKEVEAGYKLWLDVFSAFESLLEPWGRARDVFGELERVPRAPQRKM